MNTGVPIGIFLSMFLTQLPVLLVCLVAAVVVVVKWKQAGSGSIWALCGFGLAVFLGLAVPVVQTLVHFWMMQGGNFPSRAPILSALGILWSVLRAATYVLLLLAVFAGRSTPTAGNTLPPAPV